jgi:CRISPR/Cas system-associated exonuclease Cas4 (RecB family)
MIKKLIYDYFLKQEKHHNHENKKINFGASYFHECKRKIFYKKTYVKESNPLDTHTYIKFEMGHSVHDSIQNILKEIGIYKEGEDFREISWGGLDWIYRIDGLLEVNNEQYIIEIKSVYSSGYTSIENKPKPEHLQQLQLYQKFEKINRGILLYIGRDTGYIVEYHNHVDTFNPDQFEQQKLIELKQLKTMIENNQLPNRDHQRVFKKMPNGNLSENFQKNGKKYKTYWACSYCMYKDLCYQKEIKYLHQHGGFIIDDKYIKE